MQTRQAGPTGRGARHRGWLTAAPARQPWRLGLRVAGAGLLAATGAIHLDLYLTGYRSIPIIGWMFLLQVITAVGLAVAVLATGSRLLAAAGAGFALATLGGYLLSIWVGLFGSWSLYAASRQSRGITPSWLQGVWRRSGGECTSPGPEIALAWHPIRVRTKGTR